MARGTAWEVLKGSDVGKRTALRQPLKRARAQAGGEFFPHRGWKRGEIEFFRASVALPVSESRTLAAEIPFHIQKPKARP